MTYSNANFTPELNGYSNVKPFRFWCQKVLPLVYDDSLSYYELLCKVVDYINNIITDLSTTEGNVDALLAAYNQLQDYVNEYFTNLDVQEEINNKLDAMFEDGTIPTMIEEYVYPYIQTLNQNYAQLDTQINETMTTQNENIANLTTRVNNLVINNTTNLTGYNVVTVESTTAEGGNTVTENIPVGAEILQVCYSGYNDTNDVIKSDNISYESTPNVPSSTQQQVEVTITDATDTRFNVFITYAISQDIEIAELTDIRVGYDNIVYSSAGNAVREQVEKLDNALNNTWKSVLLESIPVYDVSASNWYKSVTNALENIEYDFVITSQTAGTFLFQIGYGGSASAMTLTVGEYTFTANETKTITYTPVGTQLKYFRFYSESVSAANTIWTLAIQRTIKANEIQNTQENISEINTLLKCEYLPTVKGEYYNTSGSTVDINSPSQNPGWNSAVISCVEGDVFTITGTGGSTPKLWAFAESDGTIISKQDSSVNPSSVTNYILYAPKDSAYFIVNFNNANPFRLLKGLTLDYRFSIEDYENRITTKHKIIVDANGNGDYTTIQNAINAITDSSFSNQYEIVLLSGTYNEQNLILPPFTYLHGVGLTKPVITSVGLSDYLSVIDVQNTCRIANIKVISGTKYCIHEDVKLHDCSVICENVDFEQTGTMSQVTGGNGTFANAKFVFKGCTFKGGNIVSHTNSNSYIGVTQKIAFEYCKFDGVGIVLTASGSVNSNAMAECICEIIGCAGDTTTPLLTCRVPTDYESVYPWKVIGGGNINFSVIFDGQELSGVINTTDVVS